MNTAYQQFTQWNDSKPNIDALINQAKASYFGPGPELSDLISKLPWILRSALEHFVQSESKSDEQFALGMGVIATTISRMEDALSEKDSHVIAAGNNIGNTLHELSQCLQAVDSAFGTYLAAKQGLLPKDYFDADHVIDTMAEQGRKATEDAQGIMRNLKEQIKTS
jgi:hypothetical protein